MPRLDVIRHLIPHRFLADQLRRPTGRFGRLLVLSALNSRNESLLDAAVDALAIQPGETFLDVGFGGGAAIRRAAEQGAGDVWGVDFSPDVILEGHRRLANLVREGRAHLVAADAADLPLRDGMVDAICTTNTIYFLPDLPRALQELWRVLRIEGRVAVGYSDRARLASNGDVTQHGFRPYEPEEVELALRGVGFEEVRSSFVDDGEDETPGCTVVTVGKRAS